MSAAGRATLLALCALSACSDDATPGYSATREPDPAAPAPATDAGHDDLPVDAGPGSELVDAAFHYPPPEPEPAWEPLAIPSCLAELAIDPDVLHAQVAELSGETSVVLDGESVRIDERTSEVGRARARAYLRERYLELGYDVSEQAYAGGANLIAERSGDDDTFLIVSAHLDAVSGSPGADDDASGLVTSLAIATALADCPLSHRLRFVAFDQEELGFVGSLMYADRVQAEGTTLALGQMQFDMIGYDGDGDGTYLVVDCDFPDVLFLTQAIVDAVGTLALPLHFTRDCNPGSDHGPFWAIGVPALVLGESFFRVDGPPDPNPCYHQSCDTADALDYEYMANLAAAATLAVAEVVVGQ